MKHIKQKFSGHLEVEGIRKTLDELKQKHPEINTDMGETPPILPDDMKAVLFTEKEEAFYAFSFVEEKKLFSART